MLTRRLALAAAAALPMAACAPSRPGATDDGTQPMRISYGDDSSQFGELTRPSTPSKGVVVVIHGGFWKAEYDLDLGRPLARSLAANGWTAWNIEYRRVGAGGGAPATFDDVHAAIDHLSTLDNLDLTTTLTLGHSAGGHLAVWAAGRQHQTAWQDTQVVVAGALSQAGVLDLRTAQDDDLGGGAVQALLGQESTTVDAMYDPQQQIPLDVPVRCIHGRSDDIVPPNQSADYVKAASSAGADAAVVAVDGDHFVVIDVDSPTWTRQLELLDELKAAATTQAGR